MDFFAALTCKINSINEELIEPNKTNNKQNKT